MEELSAVGEQVFDAECILNKRLRKVGLQKRPFHPHSAVFRPSSGGFSLTKPPLLPFFCALVSGKVGVSGEVEGMVIQVSATQPEQWKQQQRIWWEPAASSRTEPLLFPFGPELEIHPRLVFCSWELFLPLFGTSIVASFVQKSRIFFETWCRFVPASLNWFSSWISAHSDGYKY